MMLWLRMMRCWIVQGLGKGLIWIMLISGAGYAAYKMNDCPKDQTCVQDQKMKGKR